MAMGIRIFFITGIVLAIGLVAIPRIGQRKQTPPVFVDTCPEKKDYFVLPWKQSVIQENKNVVSVTNLPYSFSFQYPHGNNFFQENVVQDREEFISMPRAVYSLKIQPRKPKEAWNEARAVMFVVYPTYCLTEQQWGDKLLQMNSYIRLSKEGIWTKVDYLGDVQNTVFYHAHGWHYELQYQSSRGRDDDELLAVFQSIVRTFDTQSNKQAMDKPL